MELAGKVEDWHEVIPEANGKYTGDYKELTFVLFDVDEKRYLKIFKPPYYVVGNSGDADISEIWKCAEESVIKGTEKVVKYARSLLND